MSASMLFAVNASKTWYGVQTRVQSPTPAEIFPMVKSDEDWRFKSCSCQFQFSKYHFEQVSLCRKSNGQSCGKSEQKYKRAKISSHKSIKTQCSRKREVHSSTHCVNLDKTKCSSSWRKTRRREKRRMKEVEASFKSSVLCVWKI